MSGALGVVFGDIGTSPLYAFAPVFTQVPGIAPNAENIFGAARAEFDIPPDRLIEIGTNLQI